MAPLEDGVVLNTKSLCDSISREMKARKITQKVFAKKVANLSHYYLPRILRAPMPWENVSSLGRMTYIRLHNWIQLPEKERMEIVNCVLPKKKASMRLSKPKRRTMKFTEVQKKALNAIFEVTEKPPRETMQMISEHLQLEFKTVLNYFNRNRQRQLDLQRQQIQTENQ
ncbi:Protein CBG19500 [Caenorhabditis briggsae]|uniref:One cut domain family member n=2 Tax=Caenorhabditis briggsae TaxID=6238 RepID=A8XVR7_CAEBR|nr:Protein CBG19500 [Caenorhabditis briggsae]CAP36736.2 Protein CBG19500 [Caenorhabditis briggsae]